jgi:hypothetical protein
MGRAEHDCLARRGDHLTCHLDGIAIIDDQIAG